MVLAKQRGWPSRNAYTLRRVERLEIYGVEVPLTVTVKVAIHVARVAHSNDVPVELTVFLRPASGRRSSPLWSMLSSLFGSRPERRTPITTTVPTIVTQGNPVTHSEVLAAAEAQARPSRPSLGDDESKEDDDTPDTMAFTQVCAGTVVTTGLLVDVAEMENMITI
jgi:hypothetical protein